MLRKLSLEKIANDENTKILEVATPNKAYPEELISFFVQNFKQRSNDQKMINDVRIASGELIANAIDYGNKKDSWKKLRLYCLWVRRKFYFVIQDQGAGFDIDEPVFKGFPPPEGSAGLAISRQRVDLLYNFRDCASYCCKKTD
ncbi:ATP-binding protein [Candidatus Woesearchaeota archaeon]|nr:ATP-binding protein [Candidatus Woesearchaeota archaeon]